MSMSIPNQCPSCRATMEVHVFSSVSGDSVELDLCFQCHGMWFDPQENLKLAPDGVASLFRLLHERRDAARQPLADTISCPRCSNPLTQGFDVVRSGRYITYRCPRRHGRFSVFSSFMIEKGFVRMLTRPEILDIAKRVAVIHCSSCGARVDIRNDAACPHCRCAFTLIDPKAVEQALQGYANTNQRAGDVHRPDLADALVMVERDRLRAQREAKSQTGFQLTNTTDSGVDLLTIGVALVWAMLN